MSALSPILHAAQGQTLIFWCPGCRSSHSIKYGPGSGPRWTWNGDATLPTFFPSVLVRTGRAVDPAYEPEPGDPPEVCHSFVTAGQIQFLSDCTHALAGQTVDLPPFPSENAP